MINNSLLTPKRAIFNLLGSLCNEPKLLFKDNMELNVEDFYEDLYKYLFSAINNLIISNPGITQLTAVDIDNYLAQDNKLYEVYKTNNGFDWISKAIKQCNTQLYEHNYSWIKKYSLIRDFNTIGFDITDIYDPETPDLKHQHEQVKNLEKMELHNIIEHINLKTIKVKNKWNIGGSHKTYAISDGLNHLLEKLKEAPEYGHPFLNKYYNAIFRGMRNGKLMIKSAGTGVGKTRTALMDIVSVSCDEIFDLHAMKWVSLGKCRASTFISTELEKEEIQTCLLAIISGVSEDVIKSSRYSEDTLRRIVHAIDVLNKAPINLHYIDDFSISDIESIIEKDILEMDSRFIWFDYLQITPKLSRTIQEEYDLGLREDQILQNFSSRLKTMATKYNIYICTATQLNRNSNDRTQRDATSIRGGSAVIDKADHAIQMYKVTQEDVKNIDGLIKRTQITPNFMHIIYKNRSGRNNLIVWTVMNHGNMREKLLFLTDMDYNLINDINPLDLDIA